MNQPISFKDTPRKETFPASRGNEKMAFSTSPCRRPPLKKKILERADRSGSQEDPKRNRAEQQGYVSSPSTLEAAASNVSDRTLHPLLFRPIAPAFDEQCFETPTTIGTHVPIKKRILEIERANRSGAQEDSKRNRAEEQECVSSASTLETAASNVSDRTLHPLLFCPIAPAFNEQCSNTPTTIGSHAPIKKRILERANRSGSQEDPKRNRAEQQECVSSASTLETAASNVSDRTLHPLLFRPIAPAFNEQCSDTPTTIGTHVPIKKRILEIERANRSGAQEDSKRNRAEEQECVSSASTLETAASNVSDRTLHPLLFCPIAPAFNEQCSNTPTTIGSHAPIKKRILERANRSGSQEVPKRNRAEQQECVSSASTLETAASNVSDRTLHPLLFRPIAPAFNEQCSDTPATIGTHVPIKKRILEIERANRSGSQEDPKRNRAEQQECVSSASTLETAASSVSDRALHPLLFRPIAPAFDEQCFETPTTIGTHVPIKKRILEIERANRSGAQEDPKRNHAEQEGYVSSPSTLETAAASNVSDRTLPPFLFRPIAPAVDEQCSDTPTTIGTHVASHQSTSSGNIPLGTAQNINILKPVPLKATRMVHGGTQSHMSVEFGSQYSATGNANTTSATRPAEHLPRIKKLLRRRLLESTHQETTRPTEISANTENQHADVVDVEPERQGRLMASMPSLENHQDHQERTNQSVALSDEPPSLIAELPPRIRPNVRWSVGAPSNNDLSTSDDDDTDKDNDDAFIGSIPRVVMIPTIQSVPGENGSSNVSSASFFTDNANEARKDYGVQQVSQGKAREPSDSYQDGPVSGPSQGLIYPFPECHASSGTSDRDECNTVSQQGEMADEEETQVLHDQDPPQQLTVPKIGGQKRSNNQDESICRFVKFLVKVGAVPDDNAAQI